ncbi:MAG TPA: EamA family transporter [Verrucomicrobiae bacterium]|nr:EamA family transporter [Verrucomicrobiae bacterium]
MNATTGSQRPPLSLIIAAFAAVYLIWGSTYLVIRYAIDSLPPFLMAGSRFFFAGVILFAWAMRGQTAWPTRREWRDATIVGTLLLLGGNGGVTWAEQTIPSSIAALMVAMTPLWMALLGWRSGAGRPTRPVLIGLALGFAGVALLVLNGKGYDGQALDRVGLAVLLIATIAWAGGSLFSRSAAKPKSALLTIGMQMITGGAVMTLVGVGFGETRQIDPGAITASSLWAWLYLMTFGALVGFTAYVWLLQVCSPSKVSTYAFVNPVIAVALGCTLGKEPFSLRLVFATTLIVIAVLLIIRGGPPRPRTAGPAASLLTAEKPT